MMVANTPMDTDKVKIYGSKVKVDSVAKVAEIEAASQQAQGRKFFSPAEICVASAKL